jgi:hypothetical protein
MWRWSCLGLTLVASMTACGSYVSSNGAAYSALNPPPRPFVRRTQAEVDVFFRKSPLRPHIDVGRFEVAYRGTEVVRDGVNETTADMLTTLRVNAALRGCDAVEVHDLVEGAPGPCPTPPTPRFRGCASVRYVMTGICAMYTDEAAQRTNHMPAPPLPGEGQSCLTGVGLASVGHCPIPFVCRKNRCVSPYQ